jgi:hypothetical protein
LKWNRDTQYEENRFAPKRSFASFLPPQFGSFATRRAKL